MPPSAAKPVLGITMGDPLGIGPEIILKSLPEFRSRCDFKVFGDAELLAELPQDELQAVSSGGFIPGDGLSAGRASVAYLDQAMQAWREGSIEGLITAPISKAHVLAAGFPFPGHTEYLAAATKRDRYQMMMVGPKLRVSLVTIHRPLAEVAAALNPEMICQAIEITHRSLVEWFGIAQPRVAVAGFNPHAGEAGHLGTEEIEIIAPAVARANAAGLTCSGPRVPDAVFHEAYRGDWDAVVCMYHDQGLIPFKMIHFESGVNVTLGLPLIRTSPDHGTAFDIAGQDRADSSSMKAAIGLCLEMVIHRRLAKV